MVVPVRVLSRALRRKLRAKTFPWLARIAVVPCVAGAIVARVFLSRHLLFASTHGSQLPRQQEQLHGVARTPYGGIWYGWTNACPSTGSAGMFCLVVALSSGKSGRFFRRRLQRSTRCLSTASDIELESAIPVLQTESEEMDFEGPEVDFDSEDMESENQTVDMESPFKEGNAAQAGRPKLPLTLENVELVLDELRPYLQKDGGDCEVTELEGPILRLEMQGSCSSCSSSAITLKRGIEATLLDRIPELHEVIAEMPGMETPTEEGIEQVLDTIQPFLSVSGGTIELVELFLGEELNSQPTVTLGMTGPPQKNASIKMEVIRRVKFKYAQAIVEIIGDEDD
mmetsp:Transcript_36106/g.71430  ORF Transcript_36106/g.71430 Transcript_36106/m.71430 type:complete len:341 (+) Transcript_36106:59-1081(+)